MDASGLRRSPRPPPPHQRTQAYELRDGGSRYMGKGVLKAVGNVNTVIAPKLVGKDETAQADIDKVGGRPRPRRECLSTGPEGPAREPTRMCMLL